MVNGKLVQKEFKVEAVSPANYAYVGCLATCDADAHGCIACPHKVVGLIVSGSPNVFVNGKPAARVGDRGVHMACCREGEFEIISGDGDVRINGRAAAKKDVSKTRHCGGTGRIIMGAHRVRSRSAWSRSGAEQLSVTP